MNTVLLQLTRGDRRTIDRAKQVADSAIKLAARGLLAGACMGLAVLAAMETSSHAQAQTPVPLDRRRQLSPERAARMEGVAVENVSGNPPGLERRAGRLCGWPAAVF